MSMILGKTGKSGSTSIIATGSMPITKVGNTSSANTTFTNTTVTDSSAWDLSAPAVGDFAKTSDGWIGLITGVTDASDLITVEQWINIASGAKSKEGSGLPVAGSTVTCHKLFRCSTIKLKADHANGSAGVHIQRTAAATTSAYELLANETITLFPEHGSAFVDATLINAISSSGSIGLWWCADAQ